ncbi:MAG TPA: hypothetical protein VKB27_06545 [Gammaproteobacteria bacterium]|nr:hypothetical protein [Gammaproteobacteria bacterium]
MEYALLDESALYVLENLPAVHDQYEVVPVSPELIERESLSENFISDLEGWARHALAANGFGDY